MIMKDGITQIELEYDILCYRVMYRDDTESEWNIMDFAVERNAYETYQSVRRVFRYAKMLKIEKVI